MIAVLNAASFASRLKKLALSIWYTWTSLSAFAVHIPRIRTIASNSPNTSPSPENSRIYSRPFSSVIKHLTIPLRITNTLAVDAPCPTRTRPFSNRRCKIAGPHPSAAAIVLIICSILGLFLTMDKCPK